MQEGPQWLTTHCLSGLALNIQRSVDTNPGTGDVSTCASAAFSHLEVQPIFEDLAEVAAQLLSHELQRTQLVTCSQSLLCLGARL